MDPVGSPVRFRIAADDAGVLAEPPVVTPAGVLGFTPAKDAYGSVVAEVTAIDAAGAETPHPLRLTVLPVNDPPAFAPRRRCYRAFGLRRDDRAVGHSSDTGATK